MCAIAAVIPLPLSHPRGVDLGRVGILYGAEGSHKPQRLVRLGHTNTSPRSVRRTLWTRCVGWLRHRTSRLLSPM
jgi:hypothetical protein